MEKQTQTWNTPIYRQASFNGSLEGVPRLQPRASHARAKIDQCLIIACGCHRHAIGPARAIATLMRDLSLRLQGSCLHPLPLSRGDLLRIPPPQLVLDDLRLRP